MKYFLTSPSPDIVGVGFENVVYAKAVAEDVNNFTICVITNVTLNGDRTASAVLRTEDLSAKGMVASLNPGLLFQMLTTALEKMGWKDFMMLCHCDVKSAGFNIVSEPDPRMWKRSVWFWDQWYSATKCSFSAFLSACEWVWSQENGIETQMSWHGNAQLQNWGHCGTISPEKFIQGFQTFLVWSKI